MIGLAALDGEGTIELLQQDHEGEFVLHGETRERPDFVALITQGGRVTIGAAQ